MFFILYWFVPLMWIFLKAFISSFFVCYCSYAMFIFKCRHSYCTVYATWCFCTWLVINYLTITIIINNNVLKNFIWLQCCKISFLLEKKKVCEKISSRSKDIKICLQYDNWLGFTCLLLIFELLIGIQLLTDYLNKKLFIRV